MALQMNYTADDGMNYPECYIPVNYILAYPSNSTIVAAFYPDKTAYEAGADPLKVPTFDTDTASLEGSLFQNSWTYLLTLPEFAGAVEVP